MRNSIGCVAALFVGAACGKGDNSSTSGNNQPSLPMTTVALLPGDLTSDVGPTPIEAVISGSKESLSAEITALEPLLSLRTYPEDTEVPTTKTHVDVTSTDPRAHIAVAPVTPLADRWYALKLAPIPSTVAVRSLPAAYYHHLTDGTGLARFRLGSDPKLQMVTFCQDKGGLSAHIQFSENVVLAPDPSKYLGLKLSDGTNCPFNAIPAAPEYGKPPASAGSIDASAVCPLGDYTKPLTLTIGSGAVAAAGAPMSAETDAVAVSTLPVSDQGSGCTAFRP